MKVRSLFLVPLLWLSPTGWYYNLHDAEKLAREDHKCILLNFSGSDWCGPCIRMKKELFESAVFKEMADSELILVNADFPRTKKNQLSPEQQKINDEMADSYNPKGLFPYTLLIDPDGKVLANWEGLPDESPEAFVVDIRNVVYTNNKNR